MVDLDIGDIFLNCMLADDGREKVGIDLTPFFLEVMKGKQATLWEQWLRIAMGLKMSPNYAVRFYLNTWCQDPYHTYCQYADDSTRHRWNL